MYAVDIYFAVAWVAGLHFEPRLTRPSVYFSKTQTACNACQMVTQVCLGAQFLESL